MDRTPGPHHLNSFGFSRIRISIRSTFSIKTCTEYLEVDQVLPVLVAVLRIRIHRIHMFLGLLDPDPLVRGMDPDPSPDPDPSIIMQKQ